MEPFETDFKVAPNTSIRSMFSANATQDLIQSIVEQISVATPITGSSVISEKFKWSMKNVPAVLATYADKLRNIHTLLTGKESTAWQCKPYSWCRSFRCTSYA